MCYIILQHTGIMLYHYTLKGVSVLRVTIKKVVDFSFYTSLVICIRITTLFLLFRRREIPRNEVIYNDKNFFGAKQNREKF